MAEVIKMPRMSDTMTEGVIVSWIKKEGDTVKSGDVLAEVETDKATMELESYTDGVLLHIGVKEGNSVAVDGVIAVIGKAGEDWQAAIGGASAPAPKQEAAPANAAPQASAAPTPVSQASAPQATAPQASTATQAAPEAQSANSDSHIKASPLAKKLAEEKGININQVPGSGDNGRIVKRDIENYTPQAAVKQQPTSISVPAPQGEYEDVQLSQMRKTIARRLAESMFSAPHFYLTVAVNMDNTIEYRKRINEFSGEKVSFNDIIIKAAAVALMRHPKVNASWLGDKIRYYKYVNIGVAIAVDEGLVVPVVRNADDLRITEISNAVKASAEKAKNKKLQPQDFEGSTFTISNLGMFGIEEFTAIINPPDACILAVGKISETAIVKDGQVKVGNIMKMTLSCDHRVVDGATGAQFLQTLKQFLEDPVIILA